MQKTATKAKSSSSYTRPALQKSTTLSRKYVRRPGTTKKINDVKKTNTQKVVKAQLTNKAMVAKKDSKEPEVAFKTKAKAAELSEAISASAGKAPIKMKAVEKSQAIQRFKEDKAEPKKVSEKAAADLKAEIQKEIAKIEEKAKAEKEAVAEKASETQNAVKAEAAKAKKDEVAKAAVKSKAATEPKATKAVAKPRALQKRVGGTKRPFGRVVRLKSAKVVKTKDANKAASDAARAAMRGLATENVKPMKKQHRGRRILLAFGCTAAVVAALGAFVTVNMPNISVKVAAMQTGIDASYPEVVPRNYTMETVASNKDGIVTMKFVNPEGYSFILTEEKSTWDSTAVLNNYVKNNYSSNYSTMHEQGITYYSEPGSAAWVNGGILYKITSSGKNLTKEQIRNLVVSL